MDNAQALEIKNATVRFQGRPVLEDFSMSVRAGAKVLLTGPSGCGKSTALRCFLGFATLEAGSVHVDGTPLTADTVWSARRHLAYVPQEPDLGDGTVSQVLERPFHYRANAGRRDSLQRVPELFERFGLSRHLLDKEASDLSGGEKQRVALIAAVLLERPVFLLDEVTSALDRVSKAAVVDYFRSRDDVTALFVAHDSDTFSFADQVIEIPG